MTLKEALVRRDFRPTDIWALRDVSLEIEPGEAVGLIGRNGSGKTTLLRLLAGIFEPTSGRIAVGGDVGSLLELGAGFHPDFTGRENVYMSGSIYGLKRSYIREKMDEIVAFAELDRFIDLPVRTYSAGMYMRLGFAIATHLSADVLLLDEVFAVGDEAFQRKCFAKIFEFKNRDGTIVFVSHDASAVERLCERTVLLHGGKVAFDGTTRQAVARYHGILALEENPAERGAGLREWGSGEVRIANVRLQGIEGEERRQFLSGEPLFLRLAIVAEHDVPAAQLSVEFKESSGWLLGASSQDAAELGWDGAAGEHFVQFEVERVPFAEGYFHLSVAVSDAQGGRVYHRIDEAAGFFAYPHREDARGPIRLDGRWTLVQPAAAVASRAGATT